MSAVGILDIVGALNFVFKSIENHCLFYLIFVDLRVLVIRLMDVVLEDEQRGGQIKSC